MIFGGAKELGIPWPKNLVFPVSCEAIYRALPQLGSTVNQGYERRGTLGITHDKHTNKNTQVKPRLGLSSLAMYLLSDIFIS